MGSPVSLAEQAKPLPPLVREVIPLHSSLELVFLVVSFLGLLLGGAGIVAARIILRSRARGPLARTRDDAESPDPLTITKAPRLSDSAPGYDVIHDQAYLRRIQEADDPTRMHLTRRTH